MAIYYDASYVQRVVGGNIPNANFVMPASDPNAKLESSVSTLINNYSTLNADTYIRGVLSVCLGNMRLKSGVSLAAFKPHPNDKRNGFFNGASNFIRLREEFFKDSSNICLAVHTVSHEARHKWQQEVDAIAKYFTPEQQYMKVGDNPIFTSLCGFNEYEDPYGFYRIEQDAFIQSSKFTNIFFEAIKKALPADSPFAKQITDQMLSVSQRDQNILRNINLKEINFSKPGAVANFYNKAMPVFDSALALAKQYNYSGVISKESRAFADKLTAHDFGGADLYSRAISTMGMVLGRLPQREKVEEYLDFATSCKDAKRMPEIFTAMAENAVPFTPEDYTRLMLCTDYYKGKEAKTFLPTFNFARVSEDVWVKSMLISQGPDFTAQFVKGLKGTVHAGLIDFGVVDKMVADYHKIPLLRVGDYPIYGCSELLDFALKRSIHDKKISQGEYFSKRAELSDNLANIINHFEYCDGRNIEYIQAIFDFANNPFVKQFPDDKKPIQETNGVFSQNVSDNLANYFEELRIKREQNPEGEEAGESGISAGVDEAKKDFLAGLEKLKGAMSKEDFLAYIKSLNLTEDSSRFPIEPNEDDSRDVAVKLNKEDLINLGLSQEDIVELGVVDMAEDVSVVDVLQGAGKVDVKPESQVDANLVKGVEPSEYALMPQNEVASAVVVKPEVVVAQPVAVVPEA